MTDNHKDWDWPPRIPSHQDWHEDEDEWDRPTVVLAVLILLALGVFCVAVIIAAIFV